MLTNEVDQASTASSFGMEAPKPSGVRWRDPRFWVFAAPLFFVVVLAFLPILGNGFVYFDDNENFLENLDYRGLGWSQLGWAWSTLLLGVYQPLAWIFLEFQFVLFGLDPRGYHLASLLLHAVNSVVALSLTHALVCRSVPSLARNHPWMAYGCSALAVALYAIHPLRVEVVAWASCQPYLPCVLFYMLSILAYLRACDDAGVVDRRWLFVSWGWFICALLSKAVAVSLPFVLILLDLYPLRRLESSSGFVKALREKSFFFVASVVFILVAVLGKQSNESLRTVEHTGLWARVAQSGYGLWFYLAKTVVPGNLVAYYPLPRLADFRGPLYIVAVVMTASVFAVVLRQRRAHPGWLGVWLAYVVSLAPNLGLVTIGNQLVADRYGYLPTLPWVVAGACLLLRGVTGNATNTNVRRWAVLLPGILALVALIPWTWRQCRTWRTTESLWTNVLDHGERNNATPHFNLGADKARLGRHSEALSNYREALRVDPKSPDANNLMGASLDALGQADEAFSYYRAAVRLEPIYPGARNNLGSALARQGNLREAVAQFSEAVRQHPNFPLARKNLGLALSRLGRLREASTALAEAVRLNPRDVELWQVFAVNQARLGRMDEAIEAFSKAMTLRPNSADLERNLGLALEQRGRLDEAIRHYSAAVRLEPDRVENRALLGSAQAQRGHDAEAAQQFREGLRLEPESRELRQALDELEKSQKP